MANTVFNNKVIEAKAKDLLVTAINTRNLMSVDTSLAETAGMTKTINVYTYSGEAEELGVGEGNSTRGALTYAGTDYTVKMVQANFDYADEDFMKDNTVVDNGIAGATAILKNKMNADFVAECEKATLTHEAPTFGYDAIVDGISKLNVEDESKLFVLIPNEWKADLRKDPDYVAARMGEVVYTGQVGTVAGLPVIASKAVDKAYVMAPEAVKLFIKKDVEAEQQRDADTRTNEVYIRSAYVCALVDATKICKITKQA
jgi:hypothetical protein